MEISKWLARKLQVTRDDAMASSSSLDQISYSSSTSIMAHVRYDCSNKLVMLSIVTYIITILVTLIVYPLNVLDPINDDSYIWTFWIYDAIYGFFWGILSMAVEMIILEVQPKHLVGRISGIKGFVREMTRAFGILVVGLLWDSDLQWFWYVQAVSLMIALLLMIALVGTETTKRIQINVIS